MPSLCLYRMCHNLGSSTYLGYCNAFHMEKGLELEKKEAEEEAKKKEKEKEKESEKRK